MPWQKNVVLAVSVSTNEVEIVPPFEFSPEAVADILIQVNETSGTALTLRVLGSNGNPANPDAIQPFGNSTFWSQLNPDTIGSIPANATKMVIVDAKPRFMTIRGQTTAGVATVNVIIRWRT